MTDFHTFQLHHAGYLFGRPLVHPDVLEAFELCLGGNRGVFGNAFLPLHGHLMGVVGIAATLVAVAVQFPVNR